MAEPESSRVVRQLRHDVDDVFELLGDVAETQREHTTALTEINQVLERQGDRLDQFDGRFDQLDGRLNGIEDVQRQILRLLQDRP